jgi:EmrB/QacA subfamily drug resistance transporter
LPAGVPLDFRRKLLAMLGLCFVLVMVALDQTVIGTALPTIMAELRGFALYAWVGTVYLLASIVTVPVFGKLGDDHGRRLFILWAIVLFTLASVLCGLAQSMLQLVCARALQGIGAGMLIATTFASVPDLFPEARERLRWQVLFSTAFGLANAVGPTLGGVLTEYLGWRSVFFINLPVGAISLWFVWRYLPDIRHRSAPAAPLDWAGALLLALTLGSVLLLVERLPQGGSPWMLAGLAALAFGAGTALLWWERRCADPVLPLALFADRGLQCLFTLSLVIGFCLFAVVYYAPLLLQGGLDLSPKEAGLLITPLALFITVGSIVNGRVVTRLRLPNVMLYVGLAFFAVAALALTQIGVETPHALVYGAMMCAGIGLGLLLPNLTLFAQYSVPRARIGVTTAMLQSTRMFGGMLGMALIGMLLAHGYGRRVREQLQGEQAQWAGWLEDPQILVDRDLVADFSAAAQAAGQDAAVLLRAARDGLIDALHAGHWLVVVVVGLAFVLARRLPAMSLRPAGADGADEADTDADADADAGAREDDGTR